MHAQNTIFRGYVESTASWPWNVNMNCMSASSLLQTSACNCALTVHYEVCTLLSSVLDRQKLREKKWEMIEECAIIAM